VFDEQASNTTIEGNLDLLLQTTTHTKTRNNTGSFGIRTNTTTHTTLKITLEASELESITQQFTQIGNNI
jgi:hypothetical protein